MNRNGGGVWSVISSENMNMEKIMNCGAGQSSSDQVQKYL